MNKNTNQVARVQCENGHWVAARQILAANLRTLVIAAGQKCPTCKTEIK